MTAAARSQATEGKAYDDPSLPQLVQTLDELVVAPGQEGRGIGTALLLAVEAAAPEGVTTATLSTS